jgi:uncharacterized membrane protein
MLGPMMRHGETYGYSSHMHDAATNSIEWAIFAMTIAILVAVLLLLAAHCRRWRYFHGFDKPLALLRLRYAKGEITHDEYLQSLQDLDLSPAENTAAETPAPETKPVRRRDRK